MSERPRGDARVTQPGEGRSFWQPVPANGYVELQQLRVGTAGARLESGTQTVDPGCYVREHQHDDHEELILVYEGEGEALVDGERHAMRPGTSLYLGPGRRHKFMSTGASALCFFWVLLPGGLGDFFEAIGRERQPGQRAPRPFPRPDDIVAIEARTVFSGTSGA